MLGTSVRVETMPVADNGQETVIVVIIIVNIVGLMEDA